MYKYIHIPESVIEKAGRGDAAARTRVYDAISPMLYGICVRMLGDEESASCFKYLYFPL